MPSISNSTEDLLQRVKDLEEALAHEKALDSIYEARLATVEEIHGMKFAKVYRALSEKAGRGDPFDAVRRPLANHERIRLWIGNRMYRKDGVFVRGWALDPDAECEYLRVRDRDGRKADVFITRHVRPDVNQTFQLPMSRKAGFEIRIPLEEMKNLPLTLETESANGILRTDLRLIPDRQKRLDSWHAVLDGVGTHEDGPAVEYDDWAYTKKTDPEELVVQRAAYFPYEPTVSIVIPLYMTPEEYLKEVVESVLSSTYPHIELCLADGSPDDGADEWIREHCAGDDRVRYTHLPENLGISGNTNAAIDLARGDFLMLCDHDDVVEPDAVYEIVKTINESPEDTDLIYTDEDKLEKDGGYLFDPFFKPDFDRDLLESYNYFTHIVAVRTSVALEAGLFREEFDGAQDYDFLLRCAEKARRIAHVPRSLYHWRAHEQSTAGNPESKLYAYEHGRQALEEHLKRCGAEGEVTLTQYWGRYRTSYRLTEEPLLTVLWYGGDAEETPHPQIRYPSVEWLDVAEGEEGLPASLNEAVLNANGEYLLFLRAGTSFTDPDAFSGMAGLMSRRDVGCVGTRVIAKNGRIRDAGYTLGIGGLCAPAFAGTSTEVFTYGGFGNLTRGVSGVSADCMLVHQIDFLEAGGFDTRLRSGLYDIDLCLRIAEDGKKTVMDPYAQVLLPDPDAETDFDPEKWWTEEDRRHFQDRWKDAIRRGDPYYNPNLTRKRNDYSLKGQYPDG